MRAELRLERPGVACVEAVGVQVVEVMRRDDGPRDVFVHVGDVHFIIAGFGKQAGDQRADLAGPEDEDLLWITAILLDRGGSWAASSSITRA